MVLAPWLIRDDASTSGESEADDDFDSWSVLNDGELVGLDVDLDEEIAWLAREAHLAHLPQGWSQHVDAAGRVYFYNQLSNESTWSHPGRHKLDELTKLIRSVKAESPPASEARCQSLIHEHLLLVQQRASQEISNWSGPYMCEGDPYYYNSISDSSTWLNPVEVWQSEINSRAQILAQALLPAQCDCAEQSSSKAPDCATDKVPRHFRRSRPPPIEISSPCVSRAASPSSACFHSTRSRWSVCSARSTTPSQHACVQSVSPFGRAPAKVAPQRASSSGHGMLESSLSSKKMSEAVAVSAGNAADVEVLIELFVKESSQSSLKLPPTLTAQERKRAKALAERHSGLKCESFGFGAERQLHIFKESDATQQTTSSVDAKSGTLLQDFTFGRNEPLRTELAKDSDSSVLEDITFGHVHASRFESKPSREAACAQSTSNSQSDLKA